MDVRKETISISVAEDGRNGPVRFLGVIPNHPEDIAKMAGMLATHGELDFRYEAGCCGYNIHRRDCSRTGRLRLGHRPGDEARYDLS